jgi:hypothetical protein
MYEYVREISGKVPGGVATVCLNFHSPDNVLFNIPDNDDDTESNHDAQWQNTFTAADSTIKLPAALQG